MAPRVVRAVGGYGNRRNDVVISDNFATASSPRTVVYFGGDIQDLDEVMQQQPECHPFLFWSLENTVEIVQESFPNSRIVAVRPSRKQDVLYSCFDNFVLSSPQISPSAYSPNFHALQHLDLILSNLKQRLGIEGLEERDEEIILIGFSKGCVVLNQLVHDITAQCAVMHGACAPSEDRDGPRLLRTMREMHWVDCGHWGPVEFYVADPNLLTSLRDLRIEVHVVTSPYQTKNPARPDYLPQLQRFCDVCKELGVLKSHQHLFEHDKISIERHFQTLKEIKQ
ncbi:hypothetical protein RvY_06451 [Ramazzottius varieornatus]|uniref:Phospholipase/carboxylesterase/thioesterase domain-containing protein n=1 Tax=Ramazzottius varieornatus TaxID=947166 RepID=A0A1D1V883_RAMVA|nr:hypothetical protein RvY_06451 [Ramazzottius varieornatus]